MKTSLIETQQLEAYLLNQAGEETSLLEARLLLESELRDKLYWQQKTYGLVHEFGRRKLKAELDTIHQKLFSESNYAGFRQKILSLFSKS
jgi:hypothetical protein